MAKLIINNTEYPLTDGAKLGPACEQLGIRFDCNTGVCGNCEIEILEGMENLNPLQQEEADLSLPEHHRLACLCVIKNGIVKIKIL